MIGAGAIRRCQRRIAGCGENKSGPAASHAATPNTEREFRAKYSDEVQKKGVRRQHRPTSNTSKGYNTKFNHGIGPQLVQKEHHQLPCQGNRTTRSLVRRLPDALIRRAGPRQRRSTTCGRKNRRPIQRRVQRRASTRRRRARCYFVPYATKLRVGAVLSARESGRPRGYEVPKTIDELGGIEDPGGPRLKARRDCRR